MSKPELIVMLTQHDYTIENALEVFDSCKHAPAAYWGAKEEGMSPEQLKQLFAAIKESGKQSVLEVVAYTEEACLEGAELAVECGCDMLLGTVYFDSVGALCRRYGLRYLPFVGQVSQRPSVLEGTLEGMAAEAERYLQQGVYGFDLLGYRFNGDGRALSRDFVERVKAPVCIAGSINSFARLDEVKQIAPAFFTIGSAFFEHRFGEDMAEQIRTVIRYIRDENE